MRVATHREAELPEQSSRLMERQAHDAAVASRQVLDEHARPSLDAVSAGLVHRLAALYVTPDVRFLKFAKADFADRGGGGNFISKRHRHAGQDTMRLT